MAKPISVPSAAFAVWIIRSHRVKYAANDSPFRSNAAIFAASSATSCSCSAVGVHAASSPAKLGSSAVSQAAGAGVAGGGGGPSISTGVGTVAAAGMPLLTSPASSSAVSPCLASKSVARFWASYGQSVAAQKGISISKYIIRIYV